MSSPCPVCNKGSLEEWDICPTCWWEVNSVALEPEFINISCGPNHVSFNQAKLNYSRIGVSEERFLHEPFKSFKG